MKKNLKKDLTSYKICFIIFLIAEKRKKKGTERNKKSRRKAEKQEEEMSVVVEGVIDLPFVDLSDLITIKELLLFLQNEQIIDLSDWIIEADQKKLRLLHKEKAYTWIEFSQDGVLKWDEHYRETRNFKDSLLQVINEYYPMYKKAMEIIEKNNLTNYKLNYNKEEEKLVLEVEDA